jgi:hypothetical protein
VALDDPGSSDAQNFVCLNELRLSRRGLGNVSGRHRDPESRLPLDLAEIESEIFSWYSHFKLLRHQSPHGMNGFIWLVSGFFH